MIFRAIYTQPFSIAVGKTNDIKTLFDFVKSNEGKKVERGEIEREGEGEGERESGFDRIEFGRIRSSSILKCHQVGKFASLPSWMVCPNAAAIFADDRPDNRTRYTIIG